jgi:hypothetical protein
MIIYYSPFFIDDFLDLKLSSDVIFYYSIFLYFRIFTVPVLGRKGREILLKIKIKPAVALPLALPLSLLPSLPHPLSLPLLQLSVVV